MTRRPRPARHLDTLRRRLAEAETKLAATDPAGFVSDRYYRAVRTARQREVATLRRAVEWQEGRPRCAHCQTAVTPEHRECPACGMPLGPW